MRPTPGFPRVFGVLVDWPVAGGAVSVFAASTGVAMLLSSSNEGPLGDDRRLTVRVAARELVLWADDAFDLSLPVDDYPYPEPGRVHVYLLTFDGLRRASTEIASLESGSNPLGRIHRLGRAVLSELRWPADPEG